MCHSLGKGCSTDLYIVITLILLIPPSEAPVIVVRIITNAETDVEKTIVCPANEARDGIRVVEIVPVFRGFPPLRLLENMLDSFK